MWIIIKTLQQKHWRRHDEINCKVGGDAWPADSDKALKSGKKTPADQQEGEEGRRAVSSKGNLNDRWPAKRHTTPPLIRMLETKTRYLPFYMRQTNGNGIIWHHERGDNVERLTKHSHFINDENIVITTLENKLSTSRNIKGCISYSSGILFQGVNARSSLLCIMNAHCNIVCNKPNKMI